MIKIIKISFVALGFFLFNLTCGLNKSDRNSGEVKEELSRRKTELNDFYRKLFHELVKLEDKQEKSNGKHKQAYGLFYKIRNQTGNGLDLILFNCSHPMYLSPSLKVKYLGSNLVKQLENADECFTSTDNLWRHQASQEYVSTFNYYNSSLGGTLLPFGALLEIFNYLNLCHDFVKLMRHPAYYFKTYRKPSQCGPSSTQTTSSTRPYVINFKSNPAKI
jgi:hypothetical protein